MKVTSAIFAIAMVVLGCAKSSVEIVESTKTIKVDKIPLDQLCITVIYDNTAYFEELKPDWGFACVIDGPEEKILFDTGAKGDLFGINLDKLACHPREISKTVISHKHFDHVGGLTTFLKSNSDVKVFLLESFPKRIKESVEKAGAALVTVSTPMAISTGVYSTGSMGKTPKEQSLVITTDKGAIVITGCAHPGIVEIVRKAKKMTGQEILFVMGGFHLMGQSRDEIQAIIDEFHQMGVRSVGPCHCTGNKQIEQFREDYGHRCLDIGVGREITGIDFMQ